MARQRERNSKLARFNEVRRILESNPPMYAHHLRERKTHGMNLKQMRRLYAMVSRGNKKAITFARNVLGIPFDETPSQVKAVVKHHVLDLAERRVRKNPVIFVRTKADVDNVRKQVAKGMVIEEVSNTRTGKRVLLSPPRPGERTVWGESFDAYAKRVFGNRRMRRNPYTSRDIPYNMEWAGKTVIPRGTRVMRATNLPGNSYWAKGWRGMKGKEKSWSGTYGFKIEAEDVVSKRPLRGNPGITQRQQYMLDFLHRVYPKWSEFARDSATKKDASRLARLKLIKVRSFKRTGTYRGKPFSMMVMQARSTSNGRRK